MLRYATLRYTVGNGIQCTRTKLDSSGEAKLRRSTLIFTVKVPEMMIANVWMYLTYIGRYVLCSVGVYLRVISR